MCEEVCCRDSCKSACVWVFVCTEDNNSQRVCERVCEKDRQRGGDLSLSLTARSGLFRIRAAGLNSSGTEIAEGPSRSPLLLGRMGSRLERLGCEHFEERIREPESEVCGRWVTECSVEVNLQSNCNLTSYLKNMHKR